MSERILFGAGFLVVLHDNPEGQYRGLDGLQWPLEEMDHMWVAGKRDFGIPKEIFALRVPEVTSNWETVYAYWQLCLESGVQAELLFVECEAVYAETVRPAGTRWEFLGYDVTYPKGMYSAIYYEVREGRSLATWTAELNEYGLLQTLEQVERFLVKRTALVEAGASDIEGWGVVVPMRLWRFVGCEDAE